jgi:transposase-like protein
MKKHRYFPEDVKRRAVGRVAKGEAVTTVAQDIGADRRRLYEWCHRYQEGGPEGVRRVGRPRNRGLRAARAHHRRQPRTRLDP